MVHDTTRHVAFNGPAVRPSRKERKKKAQSHALLLLNSTVLLRLNLKLLIPLLDKVLALEELEAFIDETNSHISIPALHHTTHQGQGNLHNGRANRHNRLPLVEIEGDNAEQTLQKGHVEERKV